jgi:hypothetical protein
VSSSQKNVLAKIVCIIPRILKKDVKFVNIGIVKEMKIEIKLPDYCRATNNPQLKVVEVTGLPEQWLPTLVEMARIKNAIEICDMENHQKLKEMRDKLI